MLITVSPKVGEEYIKKYSLQAPYQRKTEDFIYEHVTILNLPDIFIDWFIRLELVEYESLNDFQHCLKKEMGLTITNPALFSRSLVLFLKMIPWIVEENPINFEEKKLDLVWPETLYVDKQEIIKENSRHNQQVLKVRTSQIILILYQILHLTELAIEFDGEVVIVDEEF